MFTDIFQEAFPAFGALGFADRAAERDQLRVDGDPVILRNGLHQSVFHFFRIFFFGETETAGQTSHVRINDDAGFAENVAADHVGCLAAHARQGSQAFDVLRYLAAEIIPEAPAARDDIARFIMVETG